MGDDMFTVTGYQKPPQTFQKKEGAPSEDTPPPTDAELTNEGKRENRSTVQAINTTYRGLKAAAALRASRDVYVATQATAEVAGVAGEVTNVASAGQKVFAFMEGAEEVTAAVSNTSRAVRLVEGARRTVTAPLTTAVAVARGTNVGRLAPGIRGFLGIRQGAGVLRSIGAVVGKTLSVAGAAFAAYDIYDQYKSGDKVGASTNLAITAGAAIAGAVIGIALLSGPIGWAAILGAAFFGGCTGAGLGNLAYNAGSGRLFSGLGSVGSAIKGFFGRFF